MLFQLSQLSREMVFLAQPRRLLLHTARYGVGTFVAGMPHASSSTTGTGHDNAAELRNKKGKVYTRLIWEKDMPEGQDREVIWTKYLVKKFRAI